MYKKLVGILVMTLLITTTVPVIGQTNEKVENIDKPLIGDNRGALYMQVPEGPDGYWGFLWSDINEGWGTFDEFWDVTSPICDVHWWGFGTYWDGSHWIDCGAEDMRFDITFNYTDGSAMPSDMAYQYTNVVPTVVPTGLYYKGPNTLDYLQLYYFEVDLDPCCDLSDGWISIVQTSTSSNCHFGWEVSYDGNYRSTMWNYSWLDWGYSNYDVSFILTDGGEDPIPDLECEGRLYWEKVTPGSNVTGSVKIRNNGDVGSVLHCAGDISSIPNWGNWTFSGSAAILTVEDGWITVNVTVTAPEIINEKFTGTLKVFNTMDNSDYCEIDVYLETPRTRTVQNTLVLRLFERFPNAFPILRQLIGLI